MTNLTALSRRVSEADGPSVFLRLSGKTKPLSKISRAELLREARAATEDGSELHRAAQEFERFAEMKRRPSRHP